MEDARKQVLKDIDQAKVIEKVNEVISHTADIVQEMTNQKTELEGKIAALEQKVVAQAALANATPSVPDVPVIGEQPAPATPATPPPAAPAAPVEAPATPAEPAPATEPAPAVEPAKEEPKAEEPKTE